MGCLVFAEGPVPQPDAFNGDRRHQKLQWKAHGLLPVIKEDLNTVTIVRDGIDQLVARPREDRDSSNNTVTPLRVQEPPRIRLGSQTRGIIVDIGALDSTTL